jgi:hypothetical protein
MSNKIPPYNRITIVFKDKVRGNVSCIGTDFTDLKYEDNNIIVTHNDSVQTFPINEIDRFGIAIHK